MGFTIKNISDASDNVKLAEWTNITENTPDSDIPAVELCEYSDRSVHISGTFGGGTVTFVGRNNEGANYQNLVDPQGNQISASSETLEQILELTRYMKPQLSGGTGANITVSMVLKRNRG